MEGKKEARDKFKLADQLFREKKFPEALVVLDELDVEFPDTKNVIYPRAMCLARVGRFDEALDLCRQLKVEFGDPRGEKLMGKVGELRRAQIQKEKEKHEPMAKGQAAGPYQNVFTLDSNPPPLEERFKGKNMDFSPVFSPPGQDARFQAVPPGPESLGGGADALDLGDGSPVIDMAALDDLFAAKPPVPPVPAAKPPPPSRKGLYIAVGIAILVLIALIALAVFGGRGGKSSATHTDRPTAATPADTNQAEAPQFDGPEITWLSSIEEASEATDEDGKDVLLVFYSSSSPSPDMQLMDSSVWNDPTIRYFAKNWVCARIDVDKDTDSKDRWSITKLPTTILTDYSFEDEYYRQEGFLDSQQFYTAMMENDLVPQGEETRLEMPALPVIALVLLPFLYIVATFLPVLFTLMILGRMPVEDLSTGLLGMVLIGIVSPILGMVVMRATYQLGRIEMLIYYVLLIVHLIAANWIMTAVSGLDMPFYAYIYGHWMHWRSGSEL